MRMIHKHAGKYLTSSNNGNRVAFLKIYSASSTQFVFTNFIIGINAIDAILMSARVVLQVL